MKQLQRVPFTFNDTSYEVRVLFGDSRITVLVFGKTHPVSPFRYQMLLSNGISPERFIGTDILESMIELAKSDIIEKRAEKAWAFMKND